MQIIKIILKIISYFTKSDIIILTNKNNNTQSYIKSSSESLISMSCLAPALVLDSLCDNFELNAESKRQLALFILSHNIKYLEVHNNIHINKDELYDNIAKYKDNEMFNKLRKEEL
jgi:hypothetical protein